MYPTIIKKKVITTIQLRKYNKMQLKVPVRAEVLQVECQMVPGWPAVFLLGSRHRYPHGKHKHASH